MVLPLMRYRLLLKQLHLLNRVRQRKGNSFLLLDFRSSTSATPTKHNNLEATIAITDMSPQTETGSTSRVVPNKAHNIVGCLLTFEIGSTSATITKQHNSEATITGSTGALLPCRQCRAPRVKRNKNKDQANTGCLKRF
ncbi:hypothetical protein P3L10_031499 [Capsicum annuum]